MKIIIITILNDNNDELNMILIKKQMLNISNIGIVMPLQYNYSLSDENVRPFFRLIICKPNILVLHLCSDYSLCFPLFLFCFCYFLAGKYFLAILF